MAGTVRKRRRIVDDIRVAAIRRAVELTGTREGLWGNLATCCPFCEERAGKVDTEYKLTFKLQGETKDGKPLSPENAVYSCYRCGSKGYGDFSWLEAPEVKVEEVIPDLGPPEGFTLLKDCSRSVTMHNYVDHFLQRGVLEQAAKVGAGGCATGFYRGRVIVPYTDARDRWLGFAARTIIGQDRKYLYPRGMNRRDALWGVRYLPADKQPVLVVEGVFDALPLFPRAVATLGKSVTEQQLYAIAALKRPIIPCLDGDAWEEAQQLGLRLKMAGAEVPAWAHLPPMEDPGTLGWRVLDHLETFA